MSEPMDWVERQLEEIAEDQAQQIEEFQRWEFEQGRRSHLGMADADDEFLDNPAGEYNHAGDSDDEDDEDDEPRRCVALYQEPVLTILDDKLAADDAALRKAMDGVIDRDVGAYLGRCSLLRQEQRFHDQLRSHDQAKLEELNRLRSRAWEEQSLTIARWAYEQGKRSRPTND